MTNEVDKLFKEAADEFHAAQNELALTLCWIFQALRQIDKGELETTAALREVLIQFGNWIGEVYKAAETGPFFWTPPAASTNWSPLIRRGSEGIDGAEKRLRSIVNHQLRSPSEPILQQLKRKLELPKARFESVKVTLQRMIEVAGTPPQTSIAVTSVIQTNQAFAHTPEREQRTSGLKAWFLRWWTWH